MSSSRILKFRQTVWKYYKAHGRSDLPWRKTKDSYKILVSEIMLQQTQVVRVTEKYKEFLKRFPTVHALAEASLSDVLKVWSGLGYNRRGKYLHDAAKVIVEKHGGKVPKDLAALRALPGIGSYTASAVRVFAFNEPDVLIETNIRAAFIPYFFGDTLNVSDREILTYAAKAAPKGGPPAGGPREWHWALMDYGAYLKHSGVRNNSRSAHYTKQSKFEGSLRQVRGAVLRALHSSPKTKGRLMIEIRSQSLGKALEGLARDGLIVKEKGKWRIS